MAEGVGHIGERIRSETDAKLAERDKALEALEARTTECERLLGIERNELHDLEYDYLASGGDEGLIYQFQEDHHVTRPTFDRMAERNHYGRR